MAKNYEKIKFHSHLVKKSPRRKSYFLSSDNNVSQSRHFCRQAQRRIPTDTCHDVIIPWTYTHPILAVYNETTPWPDPRKVGVTCPLVIYDVITPYLVISWSGMFSQESSSNKDPPVKNISDMSKMTDMTSLNWPANTGGCGLNVGAVPRCADKMRFWDGEIRTPAPWVCFCTWSQDVANSHSQTNFLILISLVLMKRVGSMIDVTHEDHKCRSVRTSEGQQY